MTVITIAITAVVVAAGVLLAAVKVIKHNQKLAARVDVIETKVATTVANATKKL